MLQVKQELTVLVGEGKGLRGRTRVWKGIGRGRKVTRMFTIRGRRGYIGGANQHDPTHNYCVGVAYGWARLVILAPPTL